MTTLKCAGIGYAKAQREVKNTDLAQIVDTSDAWIQSRTGICSRYITETENTSDLAVRASLKALEDAKKSSEDIDAILCCTVTADCTTPSTASLIQGKLGCKKDILAFDINAACSGFIYGLITASHLLENYPCILVVASETLSKLIDWSDRNTCVLFGDGAGAAIVEKGQPISFYTMGQSDQKGVLWAPSRSLRQPLRQAVQEVGFLQMQGREVFRFAVRAMQEAIENVLEQEHKSLDDVDLIIPHQANLRIIQHVAKQVHLPLSKFYLNLEQFGNTSAASIAIALVCAKAEGVLKRGMRIVCVGFGAGLTSGAIYMEW